MQNLLRSHEQEHHGPGLSGPALTPLAEAMAAAEEVELAMEEGKMADRGDRRRVCVRSLLLDVRAFSRGFLPK